MTMRFALLTCCCVLSACERRTGTRELEVPAPVDTPAVAMDTLPKLNYDPDYPDIDFDTLRAAMTRIEQMLAGGATENDAPHLLLRLGMLKLAHLPAYEDTVGIAYVKARPTEYFYNEFHDFYGYNGHHFREVIARYPNSGLADDAAFLLTKLKAEGSECEGWIPCYLHQEWSPSREFLQAYPTSPYADSAFANLVALFDRHIDPAREDDDYDTDVAEVTQIVAGVDSVSAVLPEPLRARVTNAVARWRGWLSD